MLDLGIAIDRVPPHPVVSYAREVISHGERLLKLTVATGVPLEEEVSEPLSLPVDRWDGSVLVGEDVSDDYRASFQSVLATMFHTLTVSAETTFDDEDANSLAHAASELTTAMLQEIDRLRVHYRNVEPDVLRADLDRALSRLRSDVVGLEYERRAESAAKEAEHAAASASKSAGITGTATLAEYFEVFANGTKRPTAVWLGITLVLLAGAVWLSFEHIVTSPGLTTLDLVRRLSLAVPVAALVAIAFRQASMHQSHGLWARHMGIQLKTITAYSAELPDDERHALRAAFGRVVFVGPPAWEFTGRRRARRPDAGSIAAAALEAAATGRPKG